ncbi:MAG: DNA mismatch repair endonuclease MutL [Gemmatimonadota bacterium]
MTDSGTGLSAETKVESVIESRRIQILPDHVANQIAAGEVVERPASVIKELVENALDAGAAHVDISLRNGGKTLIRVSDDGHGLARADALMALDRHATSKIREANDLRSVSSFGFRGEALPSIAAVSRFELETAPASGGEGTRVRVAAGRILGADPIARQPGTTVTVRSLFQNVPARAKFLRSARAETRAASEVIIVLALANLGVGFRFDSNGRELLRLPPADTIQQRVSDIWGDAEAAELLALDLERDGIRIAGLVQRPDAARRSGGRRYLFVSGRPFRDAALLRAVDEAYRTTVAPGLRPSAFLYLAVPAGTVDVNVHPAKSEVRFAEPGAVREVVEAAVRGSLSDVSSAPGFGAAAPDSSFTPLRAAAPRVAERSPGDEAASQLAFFARRAAAADAAEAAAAGAKVEGDTKAAAGPHAGPAPDAGQGAAALSAPPDLWQLHDSYILAATRQGLLIIDQHSAHERVLFEEIMGRFSAGGSESQRLLFPLTLRLSPAECDAVEELGSLLHSTGFEVENFGGGTVIVHAAPNPHPYFDAELCFREMIQELASGSELVNSARNQHERIAKSLACKSAIKAGQPLSQPEMVELFDRLFATELPGHDVHGRPTILRLTLDELGRRFGRT